MKVIRFIKFLIIDVVWGGWKYFLEIPMYIWNEFKKKDK